MMHGKCELMCLYISGSTERDALGMGADGCRRRQTRHVHLPHHHRHSLGRRLYHRPTEGRLYQRDDLVVLVTNFICFWRGARTDGAPFCPLVLTPVIVPLPFFLYEEPTDMSLLSTTHA